MPNEPINNKATTAKGGNIAAKIFSIQKKIKTFCNTEGSDKKNNNGGSAYQFTPGWKIVESIREEMDNLGLMLLPNCTDIKNEPIEYFVYRMIEKQPRSFTKKEILTTVKVDYTWYDVTTGESFGPYCQVATGANGTDKSCASALSLAERYFLLKFFHITTKDPDEEPDAHDSENIPGLRHENFGIASPYQAIQAQPVQAGPAYPPYGQQGQQTAQRQQPGQGRNPYATPPTYGPGPAPQAQAPAPAPPRSQQTATNMDAFNQAATELAQFPAGTPSHQERLQEVIAKYLIDTTNPKMVDNLIELAQAIREGRIPNYR